jgi:hypothetical protein
MNEKTVGEILLKAIAKMAQQEQHKDESWKKEAIVALDERIALYNKLEWLGSLQQARHN